MEHMDSAVQPMLNNPQKKPPTSVLFVCLGNICRSPAAEGFLHHLAESDGSPPEFHVESCGIGDWHVGQLPDPRIRKATEKRGFALTSRAQQFQTEFLDRFDFILAADHEILNDLYNYAQSPQHRAKIHLMTEYSSSHQGKEVPDPYYGGESEFEQVLDMLEDCCQGLLKKLKESAK